MLFIAFLQKLDDRAAIAFKAFGIEMSATGLAGILGALGLLALGAVAWLLVR